MRIPSLSQGLSRLMWLMLACASVGHAQGIITTVAGGAWNFFDHFSSPGQATSAPLGFLTGVAVDSGGNVFATDRGNHLLVRISPGGVLTVIAGNGQFGLSGDGGPATSAGLDPFGVALDAAGNLYIADASNNRVRKVDTGGTISTVAGNGQFGFSGDGGPAISAALAFPEGVAVDSAGNLYTADDGNNRIRKVTPGGTITTVAGNGLPGFSGDGGPAINAQLNLPIGVALDTAGNLYIADYGSSRIRKVTPGGTISTVAGGGFVFPGDGGPATSAQLHQPGGLAVDAAGNLYIADSNSQRIRKVTPGGTITTVAGGQFGFSGDGGLATSAGLSFPFGLAVDAAGNLYIADLNNFRVRKVDRGGTISTVAGSGLFKFGGDGGPATGALLNGPFGIALDSAGNLYIADTFNARVRKANSSGTISTLAGNGLIGFSGDGGPATSARLTGVSGLAVDAASDLYIADTNSNRIRKVTPGGTISTVAGGGSASPGDGGPATSAFLFAPFAVALDAAGNLYIANRDSFRVRKVTLGGTISTVAGNGQPGFSGDGGPATSAQLSSNVYGLALDGAGNLYIADSDNNRIRKVTAGGTITTVAGTGQNGFSGDRGSAISAQLNGPEGVAVDAAGNLYIADSNNSRIRKVTPRGTISTVAGTGQCGFSGDGGLATTAQLCGPQGVAADAAGNLYITDSNNDRIRKVTASAQSIVLSRAAARARLSLP